MTTAEASDKANTVAEQGAHAAPQTAPSKKSAKQKKGAPKAKKGPEPAKAPRAKKGATDA